MGSIFKKQYTKPLPEGAEVVERKGERVARWRDRGGKLKTAPVTTGEEGGVRISCETATYYGRYRDHNGLVVEASTGCRDEQAALQVLRGWERDAERVKAGVFTAPERQTSRHLATPIGGHIDAYVDHLRAADTSTVHQENTRRYLERLARECGFDRLADLSATGLERWLSARDGEGMSARSRNAHRNAISSFANWCVRSNRLVANPFTATPKADEKSDPRRRRRSLTEEELVRLLPVAEGRPLLDALTVRTGKRAGQPVANVRPDVRAALQELGRERSLIYKTLVLTGLRKGELTSLEVRQLSLDVEPFVLELDAADEKNRQGSVIPLRADLANDLRQWLADKLRRLQDEARANGDPIPARLPPDTRLFAVPDRLVMILNRDLRMAGIPKRDDRGRTIDVHAMRHTFGSLLSRAGVSPRTAQAAMRHSDIKLTMNVYTDPRLLDVAGAIDALPALPLDKKKSATGTDGLPPDKPGRK